MAAPRTGWLGPALRLQSAVAVGLMTAFCLASVAGVPFGLGLQTAVLLGGIVLVGFPHGAFDHCVARPVLERLGRYWWAPFGAGYIGVAGLVWLAWVMAPAMTLAGFLAVSVLHFGLGDVEDGLAPTAVPRGVAVLAYGALPLLLPVALHPGEAAPVLAALAGVSDEVMQHSLQGAIWLLPAWVAAFGWTMLAAWRERRGVVERLATATGFVLLPPLLAFGLYFGAGHSVRHVMRLGAWHAPHDPVAAAKWLARTMLPAGVICAAGLAGLALLGKDVIADVLSPSFRVIAALTLPHMIVTTWLERTDGGRPLPIAQDV